MNVAGGALLAAFGALVGIVGRARGPSLGVALFAAGLGAIGVGAHLYDLLPRWTEGLYWLVATGALLCAAGLVVLVASFPSRRPLLRRPVLLATAVSTAAFLLAGALAAGALAARGSSLALWILWGSAIPFKSAYATLLVLLAHEYCERRVDRTQAVLATAALAPHFAFDGTMWLLDAAAADLQMPFGLATYASLVVVSGLWLRSTLRAPDPTARGVALFVLALPVIAGAAYILVPEVNAAFATRVWAVAVLAYGILRHQMLGLDVKVRFAISRSTIAAAFIAAFFLASEGAQILFGQGNEWVGLFAAGALVFALAPLQRAAERLAERAVPVAGPPTDPASVSNGEDAYRRAVRLAWKDRALTPEEEVHLFHVAEALGIPAGRAMELRHEVEHEARHREAGA